MKKIKTWAITDWDGEIANPSVSIFDSKDHALKELKWLKRLPDPKEKGENKLIRVEIRQI